MAGLAGYVENGLLSQEGITRACTALLEFKNTLELLNITEKIFIFATASLRNVINTDEAVAKITALTGFEIDVITGNQEAMFGYEGAMCELSVNDGAFVDIGGASTEMTILKKGTFSFSNSWRLGSLKLYKDCVRKIIPGENSVKRIQNEICSEMPEHIFESFSPQDQLICMGGTARSVIKIAKHLSLISDTENSVSREQFNEIGKLLLSNKKTAADIILKVDPARIHTIIPGYLILQYISQQLKIKKLTVSNYGVREGYLCRKVLL